VVAIAMDVVDSADNMKHFNPVRQCAICFSSCYKLHVAASWFSNWYTLLHAEGFGVVQIAGSVETLKEWQMWQDEVVAMGKGSATKRGVSSSYGLLRRVELATSAVKALQREIVNCPPMAREIITAREILSGIAHAIALEDEQCLQQACEVIIMCAQEVSPIQLFPYETNLALHAFTSGCGIDFVCKQYCLQWIDQ